MAGPAALSRALLALALLAALPARAGLFDDEEARKRIEDIRAEHAGRIEKLEASARGQLELANQIEALKSEIAKLRGQIEVLTHDLDQAQKRQRDFYVDLDNRLRKIETAPKPEEKVAKPDPQAEMREFEAALNLFKTGKYKESAAAFDIFIKAYPNSAMLPGALWWEASAWVQLKDSKRAAEEFARIPSGFPNDPKAPDALLAQGACQQDLGDAKASKATLEALVAKYPQSEAAKIARDRLKPAKKPAKK